MSVDLGSLVVRCTRGIHSRAKTYSVLRSLKRHALQHAPRIKTFTSREELEALHALARACPENGRVLEIGSYLGASTCFIAAGLRGPAARVTCVDTWQNQTVPEGERDTFAEFQANTRLIANRLELIRKFSSDVSADELNGPFDLAFVDGDHSYRHARADFDLVASVLSRSGVVAFHDSMFFEGVSRVIGEALASAHWQIGGTVHNLSWIQRAQFAHRS